MSRKNCSRNIRTRTRISYTDWLDSGRCAPRSSDACSWNTLFEHFANSCVYIKFQMTLSQTPGRFIDRPGVVFHAETRGGQPCIRHQKSQQNVILFLKYFPTPQTRQNSQYNMIFICQHNSKFLFLQKIPIYCEYKRFRGTDKSAKAGTESHPAGSSRFGRCKHQYHCSRGARDRQSAN